MMKNSRALPGAITFLLLTACVVLLAACSLKDIKEQAETVENYAAVTGRVDSSLRSAGTIHVVLFEKSDLSIAMIDDQVAHADGSYRFDTVPGTLSVGAFHDTNNDNAYQQGEPAVYLGLDTEQPKFVEVGANESVAIETLTILGPIESPTGLTIERKTNKTYQNLGKVVSLDNEMFTREAASEGLWRPIDFIVKHGGGLMMLQEYETGKVPIIFVHGISGTPLEFEEIIGRLDRDKYQPWILYFPSGARLGLVSDYMIKGLNTLRSDYPFTELAIVAHSMGGLVTRSFVKKYTESHQPYLLKFVATINSPLMGMDSAASGVEHSPIIIPAWRDVATNSPFIQDLHAWTWPESVPYYLAFSYLDGEEGDGVVPVSQALSLKLQDEAVSITGYQAGHATILSQEDFLERFPRLINSL
jgi:pimeloyl-ACP methyl ester carboxylesterase